MLNIGLAAELTGNVTAFLQMFKIREIAMELAQYMTGGRKTYGMIMVGGVRRDITARERKIMLDLVKKIETQFKECWEAVLDAPNLVSRWKHAGVLDPQVARDFSVVGPNARGCGIRRDSRYDHAFDWYKKVEFEVPVESGGDVLSRETVRARELFQATSIIRQTLELMPEGPLINKEAFVKPYAFAIGNDEAPRGSNIHFTMHGTSQKVFRWRVRAATYNNWPSLQFQLRGNSISDAPLIVCSLDPCYSCTERITVVNVKSGRSKVIDKEQLKNYAKTLKDSPIKEL